MYMSAAALRGEFSVAGDVHALAVCVLVMLKGDHQVYDPCVAFPYEPHYALIAHIQGGNLPSLLPLMSTEAACFVERCFRAAETRSFPVRELLEDPWLCDRKPVLQLIPREIGTPRKRKTPIPRRQTPIPRHHLAGRDGLQALAVLEFVASEGGVTGCSGVVASEGGVTDCSGVATRRRCSVETGCEASCSEASDSMRRRWIHS